jgi:O-antigen ligase
LFCFVLIFSAIYADNPDKALNVSIRFLFLCASFSLVFVLISFKDVHHNAFVIFLSFLLLSVFICLYAVYKGDSSSLYIMRLTIGDESSIPLSILAAQGLIICIFLLLQANSRFVLAILTAAFVVLAYTQALTNTRSTVVAILISLLYLVLKGRNFLSVSGYFRLISFLIICFTGIAIFISSSPESFERIIFGLERLFYGEFEESEDDRLGAWMYSILLFSENPILGIGSGNFEQYYIAYPHNIFLEVLAENGLVGFILLFVMIFTGMKCAFHANNKASILAGALFLLSLFVSLVSLSLWMHKGLFLWLFVLFCTSRTQIDMNKSKNYFFK